MPTNRLVSNRINRFIDFDTKTNVAAVNRLSSLLSIEDYYVDDEDLLPTQLKWQTRISMTKAQRDLLRNVEVKKEIDRYKWIESEKAGYDIGVDIATREWMRRFSPAWLKAHPAKKRAASKSLAASLNPYFD